MFRKLLVATDGSEASGRAAERALGLAKALGAEVMAVSVADLRTGAETSSFVPSYSFELFAALRRSAQQHVDAVRAEGAKLGVPVKTEVIEGIPAPAIVQAAKDSAADLVVMGTHGRTGLKLLFLGSTAQGVVHGTTIPVLLVR
jgi:nucleotide-binding universal stress UspA family protein